MFIKQSLFSSIPPQINNSKPKSEVIIKSTNRCQSIENLKIQAHMSNSNINMQYNPIIQMMREQIDICLKNYRTKMDHNMQQQARQIKDLNVLLAKNRMQLEQKNQIIQKLIRNQNTCDKSMIKSMKITLGEVKKKMDKAEEQYNQIIDIQQTRKCESQILSVKVNQLQQDVVTRLYQRFKSCKDQLNSFFHVKTANIEKLYNKVQHLQEHAITLQMRQKLDLNCRNLFQLKQQVSNNSRKKFIYQNYHIDNIIAKMKQMENKINNFEQSQFNLKNIQNKSKLIFFDASIQTSDTQLKQRTKNKWQKCQEEEEEEEEESKSENSDQIDYAESQTSFYYSNQDRLIDTLHKLDQNLPLWVEIDQTGYLRSKKAGMYIVDENGDYFDLTPQQVQHLICKNVICL